MNIDQQQAIWKKGFEAGQEHIKPSQETSNFMTLMKQEISYIKEKLEKVPTRDEMLLCNEQLIDKVMEKAETKFASKITEKIVYTMIGIIIAYVLGRWLNLL